MPSAPSVTSALRWFLVVWTGPWKGCFDLLYKNDEARMPWLQCVHGRRTVLSPMLSNAHPLVALQRQQVPHRDKEPYKFSRRSWDPSRP
jgi:hypothetical protein